VVVTGWLCTFIFFAIDVMLVCTKKKKLWPKPWNWQRSQRHAIMLLTPKGQSPYFGPLKFGQAIVDAIFIQKISNFW
jgi:hypothetical protein